MTLLVCVLHLSDLFRSALCLLFCCKNVFIYFSHSPWLGKGREHSLHMLSAANRDLWGTTSAHEGLLPERGPYRWLGDQGSSTGHGARTGLCRLTIRLLLLCLTILIYCEQEEIYKYWCHRSNYNDSPPKKAAIDFRYF